MIKKSNLAPGVTSHDLTQARFDKFFAAEKVKALLAKEVVCHNEPLKKLENGLGPDITLEA